MGAHCYKDILLYKQSKGANILFNTILKKMGYSVETVDNANDFLQMLQEKKFRYARYTGYA